MSKSLPTQSKYLTLQQMPDISSIYNKEQQSFDKKSVRFVTESTLVLVCRQSRRSLRTRWYSDEDYTKFQNTTHRDAMRQSAVFLANRESHVDAILPKDEVVKCVGIVHLLSEDVRRESFSCVLILLNVVHIWIWSHSIFLPFVYYFDLQVVIASSSWIGWNIPIPFCKSKNVRERMAA